MSKFISWDDQRLFLAVLEEGSLSAAARKLGMSQPTVRKRLECLESALGTTLFTRSVNGLSPTRKAIGLQDAAMKMALASDLFIRQASTEAGETSGTVRLSVPEFMGIEVVPSILTQLHAKHPDLHIELELSNRPANLLEQEVDIAIRTVAPHQDALVAQKVMPRPLAFYASKEYLARKGVPQTLADFSKHSLIGPDRNLRDLAFAAGFDPHFTPASLALRCDSHPAQLAAARAGFGICIAQTLVGDDDPNLQRLLPDFTVATLDVWVVMHEDLRDEPRVRSVFNCLVTHLTAKTKAH
ncbi:LysR family transcriptional regulator [Hirschia litorea]|uniref:LysR family transcriptional regulator n=1 Tax=Hirschia litorea TaxID=1199156 RepID=A0ABW2IIZ6_9PROT